MMGSADPSRTGAGPPLGSISEGLHLTLIASVLEAAKVGNMRRMCSYGDRAGIRRFATFGSQTWISTPLAASSHVERFARG